ncbi:MAG: phosphate ABC transporter permease subunit PstC, partial [Oscillospiraceae bacterium]
MNVFFLMCASTAIIATALITIYLVMAGLPAIKEIGLWKFISGTVWKSTANPPQFGILPFILTSVYGTLGAVAIGVPVGLGTAIFLS